ncbi:MAG: S1 family peptidase [Fimbriimonadales bacterium]
MPKLGEYQYLLDTVFFLYPDERSAQEGRSAGGSGFLVAIPSTGSPHTFHHVYAVTNWHVVVPGGFTVLRVNKKDGGTDVIPTEAHEWTYRDKGPDIAVRQLGFDTNIHKVEALLIDSYCLRNAEIRDLEINAGEDVFMVGRFLDYDGTEGIVPAMRFGNISIMRATVRRETGYLGEAVIVDMHSRTGFSGSPVFVFRTAGSIFAGANTLVGGGHLLKLLGVHFGQFREAWDIVPHSGQGLEASTVELTEGMKVAGMSGMTVVCPAENLLQLLDCESIRCERAAVERKVFGT